MQTSVTRYFTHFIFPVEEATGVFPDSSASVQLLGVRAELSGVRVEDGDRSCAVTSPRSLIVSQLASASSAVRTRQSGRATKLKRGKVSGTGKESVRQLNDLFQIIPTPLPSIKLLYLQNTKKKRFFHTIG